MAAHLHEKAGSHASVKYLLPCQVIGTKPQVLVSTVFRIYWQKACYEMNFWMILLPSMYSAQYSVERERQSPQCHWHGHTALNMIAVIFFSGLVQRIRTWINMNLRKLNIFKGDGLKPAFYFFLKNNLSGSWWRDSCPRSLTLAMAGW